MKGKLMKLLLETSMYKFDSDDYDDYENNDKSNKTCLDCFYIDEFETHKYEISYLDKYLNFVEQANPITLNKFVTYINVKNLYIEIRKDYLIEIENEKLKRKDIFNRKIRNKHTYSYKPLYTINYARRQYDLTKDEFEQIYKKLNDQNFDDYHEILLDNALL